MSKSSLMHKITELQLELKNHVKESIRRKSAEDHLSKAFKEINSLPVSDFQAKELNL